MSDDAAAAPLAFTITSGGSPGPELLAAVAVALTPVPVVAAPADDATGADDLPTWHTAALLEGVGHPRSTSAPLLLANRSAFGA